MGVPEFYLNALPDYRRDTMEFMLSIHQYVLEKKNRISYPHSPLPPRYHPKFSVDIGDIVIFQAVHFNQQREFGMEINTVVEFLQNEQLTELPNIRDQVLHLANEHILSNRLTPFADKQSSSHLGFRDYLVYFANQYCERNNVKKSSADKMRESVSSPAMNQVRKLIEYFAMHLPHNKDAKSYVQFYACLYALLMRMDDVQLNECVFQVLGEAENVLFKYEDSFPGYVGLDNFAKFRKLLFNGKVQQISE